MPIVCFRLALHAARTLRDHEGLETLLGRPRRTSLVGMQV
jgi:hypothetical protein